MKDRNTCDKCRRSEATEDLVWLTADDFEPKEGETVPDEAYKLYDALCEPCYYSILIQPSIIGQQISDAGYSYQIDFGGGMVLWFDVWTDESGEVTGDWNKWIFFTDREQDVKEKAFQEACSDEAGAYNYATALELAANRYEA